MKQDAMRPSGLLLTAEQIAAAPPEVREWLSQIMFGHGDEEAFVLERNGARVTEEGLAICTSLELKRLLRRLAEDYVTCQVLFQLGCNFYHPSTGATRPHTVRLMDFVHHTDVQDNMELHRRIERINHELRALRSDPDVALCLPDGHDGIRAHAETQHVIYRLWQLLTRRAESRHRQGAATAGRAA